MNASGDHESTVQRAKKLAFVLSQLRDDLDEIVEGLDGGMLGFDEARAAASVQLEWVLRHLNEGADD
jgi:hypothetical protein